MAVIDILMNSCVSIAQHATYHPDEIYVDGSYFSNEFVRLLKLIYAEGGPTKAYEFRICVYKKIVAATPSMNFDSVSSRLSWLDSQARPATTAPAAGGMRPITSSAMRAVKLNVTGTPDPAATCAASGGAWDPVAQSCLVMAAKGEEVAITPAESSVKWWMWVAGAAAVGGIAYVVAKKRGLI